MPSLSNLYRRGIDVREAASRCHVTLKTAKREYAKLAAQEAADRERASAAMDSPAFAPIGVMPFVLDVADSRYALVQPEDAMVSYTYHSAITPRASIKPSYSTAAAY